MPSGDYWLKNEPIPSVSEVVAQMKSSYRSHQIEEGARLGSVVHRLIERSLLGETIAPDEVPEDAANAWAAWCAWAFHREPTIVRILTPDGDKPASEVALTWATDPRLAYGGRIDLVAVVNGRRTIIDFKTRTAGDGGLPTADRHSYTQIGGYTLLWAVNHERADSALILVLGRDKPVFRECWLSPPMITYSETEFIALRTAYNAHETRKKLAMDLRAEQERGES